jgi:hypothetical protein
MVDIKDLMINMVMFKKEIMIYFVNLMMKIFKKSIMRHLKAN